MNYPGTVLKIKKIKNENLMSIKIKFNGNSKFTGLYCRCQVVPKTLIEFKKESKFAIANFLMQMQRLAKNLGLKSLATYPLILSF